MREDRRVEGLKLVDDEWSTLESGGKPKAGWKNEVDIPGKDKGKCDVRVPILINFM